MRLAGWEPLNVSNQLARFGDRRYYGSGDITVLSLSRDLARPHD